MILFIIPLGIIGFIAAFLLTILTSTPTGHIIVGVIAGYFILYGAIVTIWEGLHTISEEVGIHRYKKNLKEWEKENRG